MVHCVVVAVVSSLEGMTTSGAMDVGGNGVAVEWTGFRMDDIGVFFM